MKLTKFRLVEFFVAGVVGYSLMMRSDETRTFAGRGLP